MGALREQMTREMTRRRMSVRTQQSYCQAVVGLAKHYRQRPERLTTEQVQAYLLYLIDERKLAVSSCNIALHGLRFFYHETLKRDDMKFALPKARAPSRLPEILSREEIERLLSAPRLFKHRVLLMTAYSAGLSVSELCALKVTDIDSRRMMIRVEQGKGAKDRYTLLSPRLLTALRRYWQMDRPTVWLFPSTRCPDRPVGIKAAQRIFYAARHQAQITKRCGIHGLRHAFATHLLEAGTDIHTLQRLLGHSDIQTTTRYVHLARQQIAATASPLERLQTTLS